MKIAYISSQSFQRRLKSSEEADYTKTLNEAKLKAGNTGQSVLIVPSPSLPQKKALNTGAGNLLNNESREFIDFAKLYWGINYIQLLPEGRHSDSFYKGTFMPYSGTSFDLGIQNINMELLTKEEYGSLLSRNDFMEIVNANTNKDKDTMANLENVMRKGSKTELALRKAFNELCKANSDKKKEMLKDIENYKSENKEWLEPKGLYRAFARKNGNLDYHNWCEQDRELYNTEKTTPEMRNKIIEEIKSNPEYKKEIEFYNFTRYLADNHLARAKKELNKKGIKLSGDMLVGFAKDDEIWMNPHAYLKDKTVGFGLPALNLESDVGIEMLRMKVRNFAKRYDGFRIDASWMYVIQPNIDTKNSADTKYIEYDGKILDIIDEEILKVKGKDYNLDNITHEFESDVLRMHKNSKLRAELQKRIKVHKSEYLHGGYGSVDAFTKSGWEAGTYMLGATNHDSAPIKTTFENVRIREQQIGVLSKLLKIPEEVLNNFNEFKNAKFAEALRCVHNMIFFTEALNLPGRYKDNKVHSLDYRLKIPENYQEDYFKALEKGEGYNPMDALEKIFVAEGLDKTEPKLYKKIVKYKKILKSEKTSSLSKPAIIAVSAIWAAAAISAIIIFNKNRNKRLEAKQI